LLISESDSPISQLLAQDAILFAQVLDDLQLTLVHPAGNRDEHKPEGIQSFCHVGSNIMPCPRGSEAFWIHSDPVFGPYDVAVQPKTMSKFLIMVLASTLFGQAALTYFEMGNFLPAHVLVVAGIAVVRGCATR